MIATATDGPCSADIGNLPFPMATHRTNANGETIVLGIEGSANKVGVGVVRYSPSTQAFDTMSNPRKTFVAPTGHGFLPKETAWHHQSHIVGRLRCCCASTICIASTHTLTHTLHTHSPHPNSPVRSLPQ
jgi:N6-L-threonylcarbamoyladenine synthase